MSKQTAIRKLTAILYADVASYSRLTSGDELGTHQKVMDALDFATEAIKGDGGTVLRYAGDAILAEFPQRPTKRKVFMQNRLDLVFVAGIP